jgi:hypothetical protein
MVRGAHFCARAVVRVDPEHETDEIFAAAEAGVLVVGMFVCEHCFDNGKGPGRTAAAGLLDPVVLDGCSLQYIACTSICAATLTALLDGADQEDLDTLAPLLLDCITAGEVDAAFAARPSEWWLRTAQLWREVCARCAVFTSTAYRSWCAERIAPPRRPAGKCQSLDGTTSANHVFSASRPEARRRAADNAHVRRVVRRLTARYRSGLNAARSSDAKSAGCSHAAKCPPRSTSLK